jgi:hypothetical protein
MEGRHPVAAGIPVAVAEQSEAGVLYGGMAAILASARATLDPASRAESF